MIGVNPFVAGVICDYDGFRHVYIVERWYFRAIVAVVIDVLMDVVVRV